MVTINIKNRDLYLISAIFIFLIGSGIVVAYNSNPANPAVMGHTVDEIENFNESVRTIVQEELGVPKSSNCVLTYDSLTVDATGGNGKNGTGFRHNDYKYTSGIKTIPSECFDDVGCVIKQELYDSKGFNTARFYSFYVDSATGKWRSNTASANGGDTISSDIIPTWNYLYLRDDYKGTYTTETSKTQFVFIDRTTSYGMKVYICSVLDDA